MEQSTTPFTPSASAGKTRPHPEYMADARQLLQGKWGPADGATLVYLLLSMIPSSMKSIGGLIGLLITGPLMLGYAGFTLRIARGDTPKFNAVFDGFNRFVDALATHLLFALFVILWALLLIIPGIIAALGYSMSFFILSDNPGMRPMEALRKSKEMMMGHRLQLFYLGLRFIGWALLSILTLGIGFLWLIPYVNVSFARFYEDVKR